MMDVIRFLFARMPATARRFVKYWLFRITGDPYYGIWVADHLEATGRSGSAKILYLECKEKVAAGGFRRDLRPLQFGVERGLYRFGLNEWDDPLFFCEAEIVGRARGTELRRGDFECRVSFNGLTVAGCVNGRGVQPKRVTIMVDGDAIRNTRLRYVSGLGYFHIVIKRPVLAGFPVKSELMVVLEDGEPLACGFGDKVQLTVPHGLGTLKSEIGTKGLLDKKGQFKPQPDELAKRHAAYLALYERARDTFDNVVGTPLMLLYGTLLGHHREGDFIPWDDDFDVGYLSRHSKPELVKDEAKEIIWALLEQGFDVALKGNLSTSFRIRARDGSAEEHLAARPIWFQEGCMWAEIKARLDLQPDDFRVLDERLRKTKVYVPRGTERFLAGYYGENWRIPDQGFSNSTKPTPGDVQRNLRRSRMSLEEAIKMIKAAEKRREKQSDFGMLLCAGMSDLYPLDRYERLFGW